MSPKNAVKPVDPRQVDNVERASWFARLAFGDWSSTPLPEPSRRAPSGFCVMP